MNISECGISICLFIIEFFYNMSEIEAFQILTQEANLDDRFNNTVSQINEFEQFLLDMNVTIDKKKILVSREDLTPQVVFLNS